MTVAGRPAEALVRDLSGQRERALFGFCIYCGRPARGLACHGHSNLLADDPNTYEMRLRTESSPEKGTQ